MTILSTHKGSCPRRAGSFQAINCIGTDNQTQNNQEKVQKKQNATLTQTETSPLKQQKRRNQHPKLNQQSVCKN